MAFIHSQLSFRSCRRSLPSRKVSILINPELETLEPLNLQEIRQNKERSPEHGSGKHPTDERCL